MSLEKAESYLKEAGFLDHVIELKESTATVALAAEALGVEPGMIAKTMSFLQGEQPVLILTEGTAKVDNRKYKDTFHVKAKMIPFEQVEEVTGHAPGGVCPFGIKDGIEVYLDESLKRFETVYPAAGDDHSAVRLTIPELEEVSGAKGWVDVCREPGGSAARVGVGDFRRIHMRDVKATGRSRGENENGGIRVGSRLGKKGHLCRKTFVRLLCLTAAMMVLGSFTAFARAGGASGGGGGGGGGGSSSHHHTSSSRGQGGRAGAFQALLLTGTFVILGSAGTITYLHRAKKKQAAAREKLKEFSIGEDHWDRSEIQERVRESYYRIQECWRDRDLEKGHPYLSQKMQQEFQTKFEWSRMRHEVFVMEGIQLLDAILVEAENEDGDDRDYIWYLIHGKMIDYVYHEETGELLKGSRKMEDFFEYWKFVLEDGNWVLDEICQKEEVDNGRKLC